MSEKRRGKEKKRKGTLNPIVIDPKLKHIVSYNKQLHNTAIDVNLRPKETAGNTLVLTQTASFNQIFLPIAYNIQYEGDDKIQ